MGGRPEMINQHEYNDIGRCVWCGCASWPQVYAYHATRGRLRDLPELDPRSCIDRTGQRLAPEPARREYAADDVETISARIGQLAAERLATRNPPSAEEPGPQVDPGDCCY